MIARVKPSVPSVAVPHETLGTVAVSKFGDRVDWTPSPGNEYATTNFPWPCPVCGHDAGAHCQPYHPGNGVLVARCSAEIEVGKMEDGAPIMARCNSGHCRVKIA